MAGLAGSCVLVYVCFLQLVNIQHRLQHVRPGVLRKVVRVIGRARPPAGESVTVPADVVAEVKLN